MSAEFCTAAAQAWSTDTLVWLIESTDCPWIPLEVAKAAMQGLTCEALKYVLSQYDEFTAEEMTQLLQISGTHERYNGVLHDSFKLLRAHNAEWPAVLGFPDVTGIGTHKWSEAAIAEARAAGCTSPLIQAIIPDAVYDSETEDEEGEVGQIGIEADA